VGNPHAVFFAQDLAQAPVAELGTYLNQHPSFPTGVNVGFMVVNNDTQISLRVYERGVGETSACGSGAAAAMIAGIIQNRLRTQEPITIHMPGGQLSASWQGKEHSVILCGLADYAFTGEYTLTSA
jgi:diaminopimelate epimerase